MDANRIRSFDEHDEADQYELYQRAKAIAEDNHEDELFDEIDFEEEDQEDG